MRIAWVSVVLVACGGNGESPIDAPLGPDPHQTVAEFPATENRNLDVLFVIDDSNSMAASQQNLAANIPNFVNQLNTVPGGLPDLHLGVVSTDMGTKASGSPTPAPGVGTIGQGGCANTGKDGQLLLGQATGISGTFISDIRLTDGTRQLNYAGCQGGNLAACFGDMARLGASGCGFEQPLAAMRRALENNPANAGFLRQDALLAVLFVGDEDDCSVKDPSLFGPDSVTIGPQASFRCTRFGVTCAIGGSTPDLMNTVGAKSACTSNSTSTLIDDIAPFHDFLVGLKADPRRVIVGGIIGNPTPVAVELRAVNGANQDALAHSCAGEGPDGIPNTADDQTADPGVRLQALFDQFPDRSSSGTICQNDLSVALDDIGRQIKLGIGTPCIDRTLADSEPGTPGLQPDCIVEDVVGTTVTPIPQCPGAATCWDIVSDPAACPTDGNLKLAVTRPNAPDPATVTRMRCILE